MQIDLSNAWNQIQGLINDAIRLLPNLVLGVVVFGLFFIAGRFVARIVRSVITRDGHGRGVGLLIGRLAHYLVLSVGLLVALSMVFPSFRARDLIQVLGIGGVAIGFAFKDIFQNFLAGVIILITRPFRIGDIILVKEYEGVVEDIQTRATMLQTYDNRLIVIPNTVLFTEEVTVITGYEKRRDQRMVGIAYGEDIERAKRVILNALALVEEVEGDPSPDVLVQKLGDSTIDLKVRWWTRTDRGFLVTRDRALTAIQNALAEADIDTPFPTQTVFLQDSGRAPEKESTTRDR